MYTYINCKAKGTQLISGLVWGVVPIKSHGHGSRSIYIDSLVATRLIYRSRGACLYIHQVEYSILQHLTAAEASALGLHCSYSRLPVIVNLTLDRRYVYVSCTPSCTLHSHSHPDRSISHIQVHIPRVLVLYSKVHTSADAIGRLDHTQYTDNYDKINYRGACSLQTRIHQPVRCLYLGPVRHPQLLHQSTTLALVYHSCISLTQCGFRLQPALSRMIKTACIYQWWTHARVVVCTRLKGQIP